MQSSWFVDLCRQLDENRPDWHIEWADQRDLQDFAHERLSLEGLKQRVGTKLFHTILHAAIEAEIVREP